jgi:putative drug exporter of the RND superfamily
MNPLLYRLGRFAARRPWTVVGTWAVVALAVIVTSNLFGAPTEDRFDAPGVDSAIAIDLLTRNGSERAGQTARVVVGSDLDLDVPPASSELAVVRQRLAALDPVLGLDETRSPDGRVAILTLQYPVLDELTVADLDTLKRAVLHL